MHQLVLCVSATRRWVVFSSVYEKVKQFPLSSGFIKQLSHVILSYFVHEQNYF